MTAKFKGWIERCSQFDVTGWTTSPSFEIYVSGEKVGSTKGDKSREDLVAAGLPDARTFRFEFPRPLWLDDRVVIRLPDDSLVAPTEKNSHLPRLRTVLSPIDLNGPGLEIGPLNRPIVPKAIANVSYVDHEDQEGLRRRYATDLRGRIDDIVDVDFVQQGSRVLKDVVAGRTFSWVVASHVGEHIPDFVGWINELADILEDQGVVSLILPHCDRTFDARRAPTTFEDLVGAHIMKHARPSAHQVLNHMLGVSAYWGIDLKKPENVSELKNAVNVARSAEFGDYVDVHCSVFSPTSFVECYSMLQTCGLVKLRQTGLHAPEGGEFFVHLVKDLISK